MERAADDYVACLDAVHGRATYVTVNISSPNTRNLRDLQSGAQLDDLLVTLLARRANLAQRDGRAKPLLLKVAPDLDEAQVEAIAAAAVKHGVDGIIATNTTVGREAIEGHPLAGEAGGLSGQPLLAASNRVLAGLARALAGRVALIGVGGILSGADANAQIAAGASLVQVYTGFIYRGPELIGRCREALR